MNVLAANCAAIIPCHNEEAAIAQLVEEVRGQVAAIMVVDDGSEDRTSWLARRAGAGCIRLQANHGKGAALTAGLGAAWERGFSHALCLDGDGQHCPSDIPAFFTKAQATQADLVIGNRMVAREEMPPLRRIVNDWMSRRLSEYTKYALPDSQCGFRLVKLSSWRQEELRTRRFEFESEMIVAFARAGRRIEFVPIQTVYQDQRSKIRPLGDAWRWLRWYLC